MKFDVCYPPQDLEIGLSEFAVTGNWATCKFFRFWIVEEISNGLGKCSAAFGKSTERVLVLDSFGGTQQGNEKVTGGGNFEERKCVVTGERAGEGNFCSGCVKWLPLCAIMPWEPPCPLIMVYNGVMLLVNWRGDDFRACRVSKRSVLLSVFARLLPFLVTKKSKCVKQQSEDWHFFQSSFLQLLFEGADWILRALETGKYGLS